jgi:23S rRNA (cytosine1962-C5)-methyltransferase
MTPPPRIVLARGRERPFLGRHPWVFSGSIEREDGGPTDGDVVEVVAHDGAFIARGLYNSRSQIRVRLYTWQPDTPLDESFWRERVDRAVGLRRDLGLLGPDSGSRLVFSEADGLSGLTADRYAGWLAVQFTSLALWSRREVLLDALEEALAAGGGPRAKGIVLRTERGILEEEGLEVADGPLRGAEPTGPVEIVENRLRWRVDLRTGQKTGAYLDQRDNRAHAASLAEGLRVADVCCYAGGFTLPMLAAGAASVVGVDVSRTALELAEANLALNGLDDGRARLVASDAFRWLEGEREAGRRYDLVVLDPPRFARSARGVQQALRGYVRLNELAVHALEPGGLLVTCSCTGRVSRDQLVAALGTVEERTGRRVRILESRGQPPDHPISPTCPETAYLKCLVCHVE